MNIGRLLVIYLSMEYLFMFFNILNIIGGTVMVSYELYTQTNTSVVNCGDIHFLSFLGIINSVIVCFMNYRYIELRVIGFTTTLLLCIYNYYNFNTINEDCIEVYNDTYFLLEYYIYSVFTQTITVCAVAAIFLITLRCSHNYNIHSRIDNEPIYDN